MACHWGKQEDAKLAGQMEADQVQDGSKAVIEVAGDVLEDRHEQDRKFQRMHELDGRDAVDIRDEARAKHAERHDRCREQEAALRANLVDDDRCSKHAGSLQEDLQRVEIAKGRIAFRLRWEERSVVDGELLIEYGVNAGRAEQEDDENPDIADLQEAERLAHCDIDLAVCHNILMIELRAVQKNEH